MIDDPHTAASRTEMHIQMVEGEDFPLSGRARRQSWYGTKAIVKRVLSWRVPNFLMRRFLPLTRADFRRERLPAPAHVDRVTATMAGVSFVMLRPSRCIVAKELYWGKGRRPRPEDQLALDIFAALARDAILVFDIGAYTGIFSLLAARVSPDAEVHAFEVVPEVAKAALDNVVANDLLSRITVHIEGVGRDGDVAKIAIGRGGSALPDYYSTKLSFRDGIHVRLRSLDSMITTFLPAASGGRVVMKIDVEGTEDVVLQHGQAFLKTHRPDILCELLAGMAKAEVVHAALCGHGYRYFLIEEHRLSEQFELTPSERYRDWLFTTKTDAELAACGISVARGSQ